MADDGTRQQLLNLLRRQAQGRDIYDRLIEPAEQQRAIVQLALLEREDREREETGRRLDLATKQVEAEIEKTRADAARVHAETEAEKRRLDLDEERVRIEKAALFVRALEAAASQGADPDKLLASMEKLGVALIGPTLPQIAQRDEDDE